MKVEGRNSVYELLKTDKEIDKVLKSITNEAFAIAREAAKRVIARK